MNRRIIILVLVGALLVLCARPAWQAIAEHSAKLDKFRPLEKSRLGQQAIFYFGRKALFDDFQNKRRLLRVAKFLKICEEPSLRMPDRNADLLAIRFIWQPTFDRPVLIYAEVGDHDSSSLTVKVLSGQGGYELGTVILQKTKALDAALVGKLRDALPELLDMAPYEDSSHMRDGAGWFIEVLENDRHRFISRHSPKQGAARELGLLLIDEVAVDIDLGTVY